MRRLDRSLLPELPPSVRQPRYDRESLEIGIAHIGVGAFHRCHQAEFIDDMLEARFGRWGVLGVNLTAPNLADLARPPAVSLFAHASSGRALRHPHHRRAAPSHRRQ